ncbi:MAG: translocation/assembly module TamB domain-containing protein [Ferruginibacter sp.]
MASTDTILKKTGKVLLWIFVSVLVLILLAFLFINIPAGRKVVRNQVENYLERKLKTKVEIGLIDYSLPKWLRLKNVYIEDQNKDTLLYGEELTVDLDMMKLLQGNTDIHKVLLKNIMVNVSRGEKDSVFNYAFLVNAFSGNKSTTANKDTAELKLTLERLIFENVALNFRDQFAGNDFSAIIKNLDVTNNKFQPDRVNFGINDFTASGVKFIMNTYKALPVLPVAEAVRDSLKTTPYELFISAKHINLRDVDVLIDNKISGMYYSNKITRLAGANMLFSIAQARGTADSLALDSSAIVFSSPKAVVKKITDSVYAPALPWFFAAKQLNISHTQIKYDDINKPAAAGLDLSHFDTKNINASIAGFVYSKDSTTARIEQFTFRDTSGFALDSTHLNLVFTDTLLSASEVYIKTSRSLIQNSFELAYDSIAAITKFPQNSLVKAKLDGTVIAFNDLYLLAPAVMAKSFPKAQFANLYVNLNTELRGNLQRLYLPYLQLSGLSGSRLSGSGTLYNMTDPKRFSYDLYIDQSNIFKKDLLRFVPPQNQKQLANLPELINLRGKISGNRNTLTANVSASAKNLSFTGRVNLTNIMDPAKINYDLAFTRATVSKNVIQGFLPPALLQQLNLPAQVSAAGKFKGTQNDINADMRLGSSYGPMIVKGYIKNIKDPKRAVYDLIVSTPGFAIGRLIKQDSVLGNVAGTFIAKGTGFDYKTMRSSIKADVSSLQYNKYNYRNADISADFSGGLIKSIGSINDSSLRLSYNINADMRGQYPMIKGNLRVDTAQLNKLHLTKDTLNFSVTAQIDAQNLRPRNLGASLLLDSIKMQSGKNFYRLDSSSLVASSINGVDSIILNAPFAQVRAGGAFDYDKIGISLQNYIHGFYKIPGYTPSAAPLSEQQFAMKGVIRESPILKGFLPGLGSYDDIIFSGSYSSADTDSALNFNATIPQLTYTTTHVANGKINIGSRNARINYDVTFDTLMMPGNNLYATAINGGAARDSLSVNAITKDAVARNWFGLAGSAFVSGDTYSFRMQDTLLLNYERWKVAPDNYIQYSPRGIIVNNFLISSDTATIAVKSQQLIPNAPIDVNIENFNLKSISSILNRDTVFLAGVLDMKATVSDINKSLPAFTGNATVTDLQFMQHPLGNLSFNARKQSDNNVYGEMALAGAGNDLTLKGNYYLNDVNREFDADMQIKQLSIKTLEAFSAGQIVNSSGNISGNVKLTGKFADPRWNGQLNFDTVRFAIAELGTPYLIDKQKIVLAYPNLSFPNFTVTDSLNHKMIVDGTIRSKSMMDYDLDLDINANDFVLVNAKKTIKSQVYGFAAVDVDVSVTGNSASPNIEGDISVNDKSDVRIVLPQAGYSKNDISTIVRFVDRDTFEVNPPAIGFEPAKKPTAAFAQFLNYNLNISLTKEAALTILLDPATGDEIRVQGDANLNAGVDPGGNLVLAGTYVLDKGYYDLHYQFLQRKFNLIKGSTISFAGEPLQAEANIVAEYIANTNSNNLLTNEVTDVTPNLSNSFNQQLPFRVILYLTGRLSKPNINFDIQLPESNNLLNNDLRTTLENKLQQMRTDPAAINKQVFSLLLFNRFVSEQSSDFFKGNGSDFNDLARQSVSQFLSSALNEIAGDIFKGIDVDLNLNSYNDFSNGGNTERTDLNVAVSKTFANDRVVISVGQNFGLSGNDATAKATGSSGFKPDLSVAYKLTADGRYLIRAYTKNQFEVVLDGYVVETGLAFVVTLDYNKFNELFRRKKKAKQ